MDTVLGIQYKGGGKSAAGKCPRLPFWQQLRSAGSGSNSDPSLRPPPSSLVVLAADQGNARSILLYQKNLDKIRVLSSHSAVGVSGPNCDSVNFTEYISKNLKLYELSNDGTKLSVHAQANFARDELARALRKGPYQVNLLLGGFDEKDGASLYWMDYLAALSKVKYGCQGHASSFCLSVMDKEYRDDCTEEAAIAILQMCVHELETRFLIAQPNFIVKVIDKDGVRVVSQGADPADT